MASPHRCSWALISLISIWACIYLSLVFFLRESLWLNCCRCPQTM